MSNNFCGQLKPQVFRARADSSFFKVYCSHWLYYCIICHLSSLLPSLSSFGLLLLFWCWVVSMCLQLLYRYRGFLKLKIQSTYGAPVAFVDFQVLLIIMPVSFVLCLMYFCWCWYIWWWLSAGWQWLVYRSSYFSFDFSQFLVHKYMNQLIFKVKHMILGMEHDCNRPWLEDRYIVFQGSQRFLMLNILLLKSVIYFAWSFCPRCLIVEKLKYSSISEIPI